MDMITSKREQSSKAIPNFISWPFGDFPLCFYFLEKPTFMGTGLKKPKQSCSTPSENNMVRNDEWH